MPISSQILDCITLALQRIQLLGWCGPSNRLTRKIQVLRRIYSIFGSVVWQVWPWGSYGIGQGAWKTSLRRHFIEAICSGDSSLSCIDCILNQMLGLQDNWTEVSSLKVIINICLVQYHKILAWAWKMREPDLRKIWRWMGFRLKLIQLQTKWSLSGKQWIQRVVS